MKHMLGKRRLAWLTALVTILSIVAPFHVFAGAEGALEAIYSNDFSGGTVETHVGNFVFAAQNYSPVVENGVLRITKQSDVDAYIGLRPDNEGHAEYKNGGSKAMNRDLTLSFRYYTSSTQGLGTMKCGDNEVSRNSLQFLEIGGNGNLWCDAFSHTMAPNQWHSIRVDFDFNDAAQKFTSYRVEADGEVLGTVTLANGPAHINSFEFFRWAKVGVSLLIDDFYLGFGSGIDGGSQGGEQGGNQGGGTTPDGGREIIALENFEDKSINTGGANSDFGAHNVFFFGNSAGSKTAFVEENGNTVLRYTDRALGDVNDIRFYYDGQEAMREKLHGDFIVSFRIKPLAPSISLPLNWRGRAESDKWSSPVQIDNGRVVVNGARHVEAELLWGKWSVVEIAFHYNADATSVDGQSGAVDRFDVLLNGKTVAADVAMDQKFHTLDYFRFFNYATAAFELDDVTVATGTQTLAEVGDYDDNSRVHFFTDKMPASGYAYSMAIVGDTQTIVRYTSVADGYVGALYDWLLANKDAKKISYVMGLGDITNDDTTAEWDVAYKHIQKLNGVIPHSVIRGNHDGSANMNKYFANDAAYTSQFGGFFEAGSVENSWRALRIGGTDYLFLALDYGPSDEVLAWAGEVIEAHPDHRVIITTHAYLYIDGSTVDAGDSVPPTSGGGHNDGDDMWEKLVRKHENIVLVISGHEACDEVVMTQVTGDHGNTVTQMLVDFQTVDAVYGATGMVTMLYFSADGSRVEVETYSPIKQQYFLKENQFVMDLKLRADDSDEDHGMEDVPYVGENGNWWVGDTDLGVKADGSDGENGADGKDGADGQTPYIGENGNWWVGDTDLGVKAVQEAPATGGFGCNGSFGEAMGLWLILFALACVFLLKKRTAAHRI